MSAPFCIYDASGVIKRTGACSAASIALQPLNPGEAIIEAPQDSLIALRVAAQSGSPAPYKVDLSDPQNPTIVAA